MNPLSVRSSLPEGYVRAGEFNLKKDMRLMVLLNIVGFGLLMLAVALLVLYNNLVHPIGPDQVVEVSFSGLGALLFWVGLFLIVILVMLVLHEAVHGLFFWRATGCAPKVGVGPGYAYAAAPGFFIPRDRYLWIGLAPAVVLTLAGLALIPFVAGMALLCVNVFVAMNFSGAVGDLWVVGWLLRKPSSTYVQDFGDRIEIYEPG